MKGTSRIRLQLLSALRHRMYFNWRRGEVTYISLGAEPPRLFHCCSMVALTSTTPSPTLGVKIRNSFAKKLVLDRGKN